MSNGKQKSKQLIQNIILDTCILQYINDKKISTQLISYLGDLTKRGFGLAISDISIQELLTSATIKQERNGLALLSKLRAYRVESTILVGASQLSTLYSQEKISNQNISIPDKIIASTAILSGSLIMTADVNDFPRPFFLEAEEKLFFYKHKNKTNMRVIQILRPNKEVINQRYSERPSG
ncbi:MAG: type II toxin-antitoxin system VapC family toxin [Candidatus Heimdallarchaeaceae archaeon]